MLTKSKTLNPLFGSKSRKCIISEVFNFLSNPLCTTTESPKADDSPTIAESPELPVWVKASEQGNPVSENPEEDFVLPLSSYWVNHRKPQDQRTAIKFVVSEFITSDVDRVSKLLRNRFQSPDDVIEALSKCNVNIEFDLVEKILKRFSSDWIPALGFFNWAKSQMGFKHSPDSYNFMVDILGKSRRFDLMWGLVKEMNQIEGYINLVTMTKVMRRLSKANRHKHAIDAFRKIEQFGLAKDVESMNALMDALVKENSVEHAEDVFLEFKNHIPPNSGTFNVLIHGWCKSRQLEKAKEVMKEMEKEGFMPDVFSYTCFIDLHCRDKDFNKVDAILDEMQEKGCPPNVVTYTILMHSLGKAKEVPRALGVYEKMKQNGCVPDSSFYSSLIYILCQSGRLKDAHAVFDDMPKQGVPLAVLTYNTMISAACEHSHEENALKLLQEMEKSRCLPNLRTYAPLLKMCCRKKRMKVLYFLLQHMFENDVSIEIGTYTLLVNGLCKSDEIERACLFFEEMVSTGFVPRDGTFELLKSEAERKGLEKERERVEELMSQARLNNKIGIYGDAVTLKNLKDFHKRRVQVLAQSGADLIALETIQNKLEAKRFLRKKA